MRNNIEVLVKNNSEASEWRFTGFYRSSFVRDRDTTWNLLRWLGQNHSYPWLVCGDFNEILYSFEKFGGFKGEEKDGSFSTST